MLDPAFIAPQQRHRVTPVYWQREVAATIRSLAALTTPDYADVVTAILARPLVGTPERLLYATLDGLPQSLRRFIPFAQRAFLGLRLELRPSPEHLLGWRIADRGDNWLRIEASSWMLTGNVVFHAEDRQLSFASFVRYDRPPAALVWPPVSLIHRQIALALVRRATNSALVTP